MKTLRVRKVKGLTWITRQTNDLAGVQIQGSVTCLQLLTHTDLFLTLWGPGTREVEKVFGNTVPGSSVEELLLRCLFGF